MSLQLALNGPASDAGNVCSLTCSGLDACVAFGLFMMTQWPTFSSADPCGVMHLVRDPAVEAAIRVTSLTGHSSGLNKSRLFLDLTLDQFLEVVRRRQTLRSVMARRSINGSCCNLGRDAASSFFDDPIRRKLA